MIEAGNKPSRLRDCGDSPEDPNQVPFVLEAIDRLLDAMEGLDAPITRELLGTAMMALVHECGLARRGAPLN
jgi:hypothetical protein